ncbi:MAG: hypothetical protein BWY31_03463 [Lentisphaerae bacterium ADurb.Bin242]|nr:MAG: hypothetical protein BWY31_03463 [Lentisphaerae bacterium ADurb.Bin242]
MMRTILFIHFNPSSGQLEQLVKRIPYAPEDSEMYWIDISRKEKEMLGAEKLEYLNNHYEDDRPYVWKNQPAHIASVDLPIPHMRLRLLKAMREDCRNRLEENANLADTNEISGRMLLFRSQADFSIVSRGYGTFAVSWDLFGVRHWFGLHSPGKFQMPTPELLRRMIREVWLERKSDFQNEMRQDAKILELLNSAIRDAEDKITLE